MWLNSRDQTKHRHRTVTNRHHCMIGCSLDRFSWCDLYCVIYTVGQTWWCLSTDEPTLLHLHSGVYSQASCTMSFVRFSRSCGACTQAGPRHAVRLAKPQYLNSCMQDATWLFSFSPCLVAVASVNQPQSQTT